MNKKATTKDELFLLKLYELAVKKEGPEVNIDRYHIGREIGMNQHGIDTIIKHLAQANFIKKLPDNSVYLTPHGISLVEDLRKERNLS
jgi:predicted transcriptional regulator